MLWATKSPPLWQHLPLQPTGPPPGGPLAALLFALVLQPLVNLISQRVPTLSCNLWFLDDGTLVGKPEDLQEALEILREEGPAKGLILSTGHTVRPPANPKSTIWSPGDPGQQGDPCNMGLKRIMTDGIILLGAPIGSQDFVEQEIRLKITSSKPSKMRYPSVKNFSTEN